MALFALGLTLGAASRASAQETNEGRWLALGDALAESTEPGSLERALEAYEHVDASDSSYTTALQRRAWVAFLLDRTNESIARYVALLDRLEAEHAMGAMRDEALLMLAAMLADPDWDHDGVADAESALERLSDPAIVPQDRAWLADLHFETAHALYLSSRDPAAIALLDRALSRWPAPAHGTPLDPACRRHRARPTTLRGEDTALRLAADAVCARHAL